jgi:hypothetical protein
VAQCNFLHSNVVKGAIYRDTAYLLITVKVQGYSPFVWLDGSRGDGLVDRFDPSGCAHFVRDIEEQKSNDERGSLNRGR